MKTRFEITRRDALKIVAAGAALPTLPQFSYAATWPDRTIKLVFPYDAGGAGDLLTRELGDAMQRQFKVSVITENRPGGGTVVGASYVANQPADGYTVLINGPATNVIMPAILPQIPYNAKKDFDLIGMWSIVGNMVSVNSTLPVKTIRELVDYSKANPGKLSYSSAGVGTGPHLGGELFKQMTGADIQHVPYKGAAGAVMGLLSGDVQVSFVNIPPQVPHVKAGKIRPLAVSTSSRSVLLPDVPTAAEAGLPGYISESWFGVAIRSGAPQEVQEKLQKALIDAGADADRRTRLAAAGVEVKVLNAKDFADYIAAEEKRLLPIIRKLDMKA